jgi:serine protease AprX
MKGQVGMRAAGRLVTPIVIFALLLGTAWTGRASIARVDVDPSLDPGDIALIQVAPGTAWTVADDLSADGATEVAAFDSVNVVSARVSEQALSTIATARAVLRATTDAQVSAVGGGRNAKDLDKVGSSSTKDSIGIDAINASAVWPLTTGAGVVVALMDSGIASHPDLPSGKVIGRVDLVDDGAPGLDPAGHGTHLAGVIAADGATFRGVAPSARLVDIRVLDASGSGTLSDVVAGFDWLLKNRAGLGIRVLNLSFGTTQTSSYHADLLAALAESAWFAGITVVAAGGNDGDDLGTIATPGADPFIITAGSFDDQGTPAEQDDRESAFSSRGPTKDGFTKPDVLAPGRRVVSLRAAGSHLTPIQPHGSSQSKKPSNNLYTRMSGTSVSSAMVSGVAALVLSFHSSYTPTKTKGAILALGRGITGSPTKAVMAPSAVFAVPRTVNSQLLPSRLLMTALENSGLLGSGTTWEGVTWEGVTWESVTWETVTWEGVSWESVSWEGVAWEQANVTQHSAQDAVR